MQLLAALNWNWIPPQLHDHERVRSHPSVAADIRGRPEPAPQIAQLITGIPVISLAEDQRAVARPLRSSTDSGV